MSAPETLADLLRLDGRVILVTGGAGGIGSAVVARLIEVGARAVSVDRARHPVPEGADALACDLGDRAEVRALLADWPARFGRLDGVVHCAGITADGVLWKMADDAWDRVLEVNLGSAFAVLRDAIPLLRAQGGTIVLISSINGERGKFGQGNYAASKAGLIGLARSVAREVGRFGVRVNVVAPGWIDTAMTAGLDPEARRRALDESALGASGRADDVARAVMFLMSPMSAHITGQVLRVDGGQLTA